MTTKTDMALVPLNGTHISHGSSYKFEGSGNYGVGPIYDTGAALANMARWIWSWVPSWSVTSEAARVTEVYQKRVDVEDGGEYITELDLGGYLGNCQHVTPAHDGTAFVTGCDWTNQSFIGHLDTTGQLIWATANTPTGPNFVLTKGHLTSDNGLLCVGMNSMTPPGIGTVFKVTDRGELEWATRIGDLESGTMSYIVQALPHPDGGSLVLGVLNRNATSGQGHILSQVNATGHFFSTLSVSSEDSALTGYRMMVTRGNETVVTGDITGFSNIYRTFVYKLNAHRQIAWTQGLPGFVGNGERDNPIGGAVFEDRNGNVVVAGTHDKRCLIHTLRGKDGTVFSSVAIGDKIHDFALSTAYEQEDGGTILIGTTTRGEMTRACIIKLDPSRKNVDWARNIAIPERKTDAHDGGPTPGGGVFVAGATLYGEGETGTLVAKLDAKGNGAGDCQWIETIYPSAQIISLGTKTPSLVTQPVYLPTYPTPLEIGNFNLNQTTSCVPDHKTLWIALGTIGSIAFVATGVGFVIYYRRRQAYEAIN